MKRLEKTFLILFFCCAFGFACSMPFCVLYRGYLQHYGAAVDSEEKVYIGTNYGIDVFDHDSTWLYTVRPVPKGYSFTIHDDVIYEKKMQYVSSCTLDGEEIELLYYADHPDLPEYMRYSPLDKKRFISEAGDEYRLKIKGIHLCVIKNGETVVFREPTAPAVLRFTAKLFLALEVISFAGVTYASVRTNSVAGGKLRIVSHCKVDETGADPLSQDENPKRH